MSTVAYSGGAAEAIDPEIVERRFAIAGRDQFSHRVAHARAELEAMPAKAEGVEKARRRRRWAHDRQHIADIAFAA